MPIKNATPEQIAALKARLNDRKAEKQMDEVVKMVGKKRRPFPMAAEAAPKRSSAIDACSLMMVGCLGAISWNAMDSVFGLLLFGACMLMAAKPMKEAIRDAEI